MKLLNKIEMLGPWYHRIDLGDNCITPGDRDQSITYNLYNELLPEDLSGKTVLDLGANACGLSIEFAKRGADVLAVEINDRYIEQANFVINHLGFSEKIKLIKEDLFQAYKLGEFDIVAYVGLSYHVRHPQLALDMLTWNCRDVLIASTQTISGSGLNMVNRIERNRDKAGSALGGYEPTEQLFRSMIRTAGFRDPILVSTRPHRGEQEGRYCGNRSYFFARAGNRAKLPFID